MSPPPWSLRGGRSLRCLRLIWSSAAALPAQYSPQQPALPSPEQCKPASRSSGHSFFFIVLLGLDLVTGAFGLVPLPWLENDAGFRSMLVNWGWIFFGN